MINTPQRASSWIITITIILAAEIFVADLVLPLGLAVWLPYGALVLISLWAPQRKYALINAIAATALILFAGFLSPFRPVEVTPLHFFFNRALGVVVIWTTALLCLQRKQVEEMQHKTHDELERLVKERTAELSKSNEQLQHEVTQRQLALAELEQTRQQQLELKDQFLSHVSHELRSPLAAVYQFVTILLDGLAGDLSLEQRDYLEIVLRNANQLRVMIEDLLEVTPAQTGKLSIEARPTSVAELIDETTSSLRALAAAKGIALSADVSGHLPPAYADPQRVRQILRNLIENGIKFTPDNGTITVRAQVSNEEPNCICVSVADTGCGISPEEREKIFERLYQVKSTIEASRKGLGLGLYICRELVSLHGGRIWVESQLGHGSTFFFTLPIFSLANLLAPLATAEHLPKGSLAVISVEVFPGEKRLLNDADDTALQKTRNVLMRCLRSDLDVLLPQIGRTQWGEIFFVVARCDQRSAGLLVRRIQEELTRCGDLQDAGLTPALSFAAVDMASLGTDEPMEQLLKHTVHSIEDRLKTVPSGKEE